MAKFLALVEVDIGVEGEESNLMKIAEALGALGEHITVEKFVNIDYVERHDNVRVSSGPHIFLHTYPVIEHQVNFKKGTSLEMILIPSDVTK